MRPDEANIKNKRRGAWDYAFAFLIGPLYVYSVCLSVLSSTLIKYTPAGLMTASALAFLIFVAVLAKKKTFFAALALLAVFAAYEWATGKWPDRAEIIGDLSRIVRGFSAYGGQYDRLITLFICSGVALFAVIFLHKKFNFLILIAIGSASFVINQIMDYSRDESALVIFVFCFVALLIRRLNGSVVPALISLPFCAAAVAVSLQIPMYKPIDRGAGFAAAFRRPVDAVGDFIYAAFNPKYFSFQNTGFTSSSNLIGGPVSVNSRAVMQVEAPARTYLSGATKNVYDGKSWTDTLDGAEFVIKGRAPGEFEYLETAAALSVASSPNAWTVTESDDMSITRIVGEISSQTTFNYVILNNDDKAVSVNVHIPAKEELRVHIGENRTGTVFVPPKFSSVSFNGGSYRGELFYGASGDMRVSGLLARGAMYRFDYFRDNPRSLLSRRAMDESRRGFYRIAREQVKDVPEPLTVKDFGDALTYSYSLDGRGETGIGLASVYDALGITADELVAYSDFVYKNYTSLPESLPERVRSLARELTKDCQTNIERIRAIENYFVSIPYTLSPPPVPEGVDFVDHFLFEAPKGYCVYYASAMAVLLRCLEIPTRYKEGFLLPTAMTDGFYIVTNRHAHAWAEAYLEGYGWLNVEATAPFILTSREQSGEQSAGAGAPPFTDEYDYYDYMRYIMGYDYPQSGRGDTEDAPAQNAQGQGQAIKNNFVEVSIRIGIMLLALAAAVAAVFAYTLAVRFCEWFKLKRLRKLPKNEQACAFYGGIARIASNHSYPRLSGETPLCYGRRLKGRFTFNNSSLTMGDLGAIYYRAKYGGKTIGKNELQAMRDCYLDMTELIREAWGPRKYLRMRYLKGVFIL